MSVTTKQGSEVAKRCALMFKEDFDTGLANARRDRPDWPEARQVIAAWRFACQMGDLRMDKGVDAANDKARAEGKPTI